MVRVQDTPDASVYSQNWGTSLRVFLAGKRSADAFIILFFSTLTGIDLFFGSSNAKYKARNLPSQVFKWDRETHNSSNSGRLGPLDPVLTQNSN